MYCFYSFLCFVVVPILACGGDDMKIHLLVHHKDDDMVSHCYSYQAVVSKSTSSELISFLIGTKPCTERLKA